MREKERDDYARLALFLLLFLYLTPLSPEIGENKRDINYVFPLQDRQ